MAKSDYFYTTEQEKHSPGACRRRRGHAPALLLSGEWRRGHFFREGEDGLSRGGGGTPPPYDGREMRVEGIDQIILAVGMRPSQGLKEALAGTGLEVRSIGDAASVKNGFSNVQEAFAAAWDI